MAGLALSGMAVVLLAGCDVDTHKSGNGDDVKIETPFGGLRVKTDDAAVMDGIGLPAYPGARRVKKNEDNDNGAADVNMSFGDFHLRVKAVGFRTSDSPEKVEAFYRDGMKRFGDVIACHGDKTVGSPMRTSAGLTCDDHTEGHHVGDGSSKGQLELKAGSKVHQHIVSIDRDGGETKFGLVALNLPGKIFSDDGDDEDKQ
jgi:hypothetical protein